MISEELVLLVDLFPVSIELPGLLLLDVEVVMGLLDFLPSLLLDNLATLVVKHSLFGYAIHASRIAIGLLLLRYLC